MSRHRPDRTRVGLFGTLLAVACAVAAVCAPSAVADSLTFIKTDNVWLANPDGSGQYQVTFDGTAGAPYESPSLADDGTIVAVRETPGQRRQIYRMTQSGQLLNAPINTPAPGTGAINAKVSPNGALVAYWFLTLVNDPFCPFCVNIASSALLSHSDRFTNYNEVGTPNLGGVPSWVSNDTIVIGDSSATLWYFRLGMPEAAPWFADQDIVPGSLLPLRDAEAAPTGDRLAVVRDLDPQTTLVEETIAVLKMNGPPPAKPVANVGCLIPNPTGKFVGPTWSSDGRELAWQEDDGVWARSIPADPVDCAGFGPPALRIPGATAPDFSPAAINPGPRPPCGNPGNPGNPTCSQPPCVSCQPPCVSCEPPCVSCAALRSALNGFAKNVTRGLARLKIRGLLRKGRLSVAFTAPSPGTLAARLTATGASARRATLLASGRHVYKAAGKAKLTVKLTAKGRKRLRKARRLRGSLKVSFTPRGATAISVTSPVRLKR